MTLTDVHPKLVHFLQALSEQQRLLSYREISKTIKINGKRVSVKTVQHWMNILRGPEPERKPRFFYYPAFYYETIGLYQHIHFGTLPEQLHPWTAYSVFTSNFKETTQTSTLLLPKKIPALLQLSTGKTLYNLDGSAPEKNYEKEFNNHYSTCESMNIQSAALRKHPLIIPCIFEYQHRSSNASNVWERIKKRTGEHIKLYAPKVHTAEQGVYAVRETLKALTPLIAETRVEYLPFLLKRTVYYAFTERLTLNELYHHVRLVRVYKTSKGYLHIIAADQGALEAIIPILERAGIQSFQRVMQEPTQQLLTNSTFTMIDYEQVYNPATASWKLPEKEFLNTGKQQWGR